MNIKHELKVLNYIETEKHKLEEIDPSILPQFYYYDAYCWYKPVRSTRLKPTLETIFKDARTLAKACDRTPGWVSQKCAAGEVYEVRVYRPQFELLPLETFKPITEDKQYWLSNHGRIARQLTSTINGTPVMKVLKPARNLNDYRQLPLYIMPRTEFSSSQLGACVLELFQEKKPSPESFCIYADGNHANCYIGNLYWGTAKERGRKRGWEPDRAKKPVKVVGDSRTGRLKPFIGKTFESITACAKAIGTSEMNIRQYMTYGKIVLVK